MDLLRAFVENINREQLFSSGDKLLLAVSGGIDSAVLCRLCREAGYSFMIAHCNFQLRGEESERDESFVRMLAHQYAVPILVRKFETESYALKERIGIQEAARKLRYDWFAQIIREGQGIDYPLPRYLVTAHHADDNAETIIMNFFRGTGLKGLTGIAAAVDYIRRPLLIFRKSVLIDFAEAQRVAYVADSSNDSLKYTRNFFRKEIIPAISRVYPQVENNLQDSISRYNEIEHLYRIATKKLIEKLCQRKGEEIHIPVLQLRRFGSKALIYEIISPFGFAEKQVEEVVKLLDSGSGKYLDAPNGAYRVLKHRHWLIITPMREQVSEHILIEDGAGDLDIEPGRLHWKTTSIAKVQVTPGEGRAYFDATQITYPLLIRRWTRGDYFYPLGMKKKKKLSRFFIDRKLSRSAKEKAWVVEMDKKIIWVVGMRIDERFKVGDETRQVLQMKISAR